MKLTSSLLVLAIAGGVAPLAEAGQQGLEMEWRQKVKPTPVILDGCGGLKCRNARPDPIVLIVLGPHCSRDPIVLASSAGATPQPDYILKYCMETVSRGDSRSAMRAVDPASMLIIYFQQYKGAGFIEDAAIKNIILLEGTKHGNIFSEVDNEGLISYHYDAEPEYVGNDRAVFMAEYLGVRYKIVVELHVFTTVGENSDTTTCPLPKLIKVKKPATPSSGANGYDLNALTSTSSAQASSSLVAGITVTFADLEGAAIGQTTGTTITLDTTAANHNWYIDPTPGQNEEYLPTSNPNEWIAKAGSDAAGKMDMLSVLLHEYGHTLGINHNSDSHDYMVTNLGFDLIGFGANSSHINVSDVRLSGRRNCTTTQPYTFTIRKEVNHEHH